MIKTLKVDKKDLKTNIQLYEMNGFVRTNEGTSLAVMEKESGYGKWNWHLLYLILLPILGNIIYAIWSKHYNKEIMQIRTR